MLQQTNYPIIKQIVRWLWMRYRIKDFFGVKINFVSFVSYLVQMQTNTPVIIHYRFAIKLLGTKLFRYKLVVNQYIYGVTFHYLHDYAFHHFMGRIRSIFCPPIF